MITSSPGSMKPMNALNMPSPANVSLIYSNLGYLFILTLIGSSCDRDLGFGVNRPAKERRVGIRDGLLETRATLCGVSDVHM